MKLPRALPLFLIFFGGASASQLEWAPRRKLKQPYVTFLNDFFDPTWMSTDNKTFTRITPVLNVPKNVWIGVICGACFAERNNRWGGLEMSFVNNPSFSVKWPPYGQYWIVGKNKCLMIYNIISFKEYTYNSLFCNLYLSDKKFSEHIQFEFRNYSEEYGSQYRVDTEYVNFTNSLDCKNERRSSGNLANTTVWWYQSKKKGAIPLSISRDSRYSGKIPRDIGSVLGCTTYEISPPYILRVYQKVYNFNNLSIYTVGSSTTIPTKDPNIHKWIFSIIFLIMLLIIVAYLYFMCQISKTYKRKYQLMKK